MPRHKYSSLIERLRGASIFTYRFVEDAVGEDYAKLLIHRLRKKGEIDMIVRGVYTFKRSPYMVVKAIPRGYVGLGSAAALHGAWDQATVVTVLSPSVSSLIRGGMREVGGHKVLLRKISDRMYFGYEYIYLDEIGELVRVSDPEKTLIDIIYYRYPFSQDILPRLAKMADRRRLTEYIDEMRVRGVKGWTTVASRLRTSTKVVGFPLTSDY
jgi:predicted transcriptional regulator of viral defense system